MIIDELELDPTRQDYRRTTISALLAANTKLYYMPKIWPRSKNGKKLIALVWWVQKEKHKNQEKTAFALRYLLGNLIYTPNVDENRDSNTKNDKKNGHLPCSFIHLRYRHFLYTAPFLLPPSPLSLSLYICIGENLLLFLLSWLDDLTPCSPRAFPLS